MTRAKQTEHTDDGDVAVADDPKAKKHTEAADASGRQARADGTGLTTESGHHDPNFNEVQEGETKPRPSPNQGALKVAIDNMKATVDDTVKLLQPMLQGPLQRVVVSDAQSRVVRIEDACRALTRELQRAEIAIDNEGNHAHENARQRA